MPKRDERFTDPWNQGVNAESFLYNEAFPARAKANLDNFSEWQWVTVRDEPPTFPF